MRGIVAIWSGAIVDIPAGWVLCDGDNNTPDLRDLFIVGAGTAYNPGDTGGLTEHTHTFTSDTHDHHIDVGDEIETGTGRGFDTTDEVVTGTTDVNHNIPPFCALAFIMKT